MHHLILIYHVAFLHLLNRHNLVAVAAESNLAESSSPDYCYRLKVSNYNLLSIFTQNRSLLLEYLIFYLFLLNLSKI